ncbi:MAG: SsrA-binding protein SmpB [Myxococcales bacterium]|jgi:SsrA-binding protein
MAARVTGEAIIAKNRKATFDYALEDRYEGGLVLVGSEVKSLRAGKVDLSEGFATVENGEVWLKQMTIAPFQFAHAFPHDPRRPRKVLLHASEIERIQKALARKGLTLVPLSLFFKNGRVKVELSLGRGKKTVDKRHDLAKKTADREARAAIGRVLGGGGGGGRRGGRDR